MELRRALATVLSSITVLPRPRLSIPLRMALLRCPLRQALATLKSLTQLQLGTLLFSVLRESRLFLLYLPATGRCPSRTRRRRTTHLWTRRQLPAPYLALA